MSSKRILVVGAGFAGAVVARELADAGFEIELIDQHDHLGGNSHTQRDSKTGIMLHYYGPHIFHTDDREVWDYVSRFARMMPYVNRVKACAGRRIYSLPINLLTINQFFQLHLSPAQARDFLQSKARRSSSAPANFEEQALAMVGPEIYQAFLRGYTLKQWGVEPCQLPASIIKRLPVRFNYDDNYFKHQLQGIPAEGYTQMIQRMLDHSRIRITLGTLWSPRDRGNYCHTFYTGELDGFFGYTLGRLEYRTLRFERFYPSPAETLRGDYQGCAVMNFCDPDVPYTRITEHKHFAPWEDHDSTVCYYEYSQPHAENDIPTYPVPLADQRTLLNGYLDLARKQRKVTFAGRLGTFRYLDMDQAVRESLDAAREFVRLARSGVVRMPFTASSGLA